MVQKNRPLVGDLRQLYSGMSVETVFLYWLHWYSDLTLQTAFKNIH